MYEVRLMMVCGVKISRRVGGSAVSTEEAMEVGSEDGASKGAEAPSSTKECRLLLFRWW